VKMRAFEAGRRLLIVDDNPATLYSTSRILRNAGFDIVEAVTGEEALEQVENDIDLVVLDVNLPGIDGFEVCRRIRARPETAVLPVVHLSASYVDDEDRASGYDAGADGYLTHPVEPPVLVGTVNSFLRTRRAEAARRLAEASREQLLASERAASERAAREEAERANAMKDQFLAMLSHELRNPLNAIVGWAEVLRVRNSDTDPNLARGLNIITNAANAQAQLIADLLDISRISAGKLSLEMQPVRVSQIVANAVESTESSARARNIATHCRVPDADPVVLGDPVRLQQVVWNLLHNAVKFTPPGGRIDVEVEHTEDQVEIVISDTGIGIPPEVLPHVFEQFRQGDAGTRKSHGGLGLGLAIVRLMVDAHGGEVSAESPGVGHGACFRVRLPLTPEAPSTSDENAARRDLDGRRVLVVEDDLPSLEMLGALLGQMGASVCAVSSVDEALEHIGGFDPELLISDIGMPNRDGFDLIRSVRELGYPAERLPAIALTAFAGAVDRDAVVEAGFQRHIAKPVRSEQLLQAAWELLPATD
jgi:signal transduction histidine kinase